MSGATVQSHYSVTPQSYLQNPRQTPASGSSDRELLQQLIHVLSEALGQADPSGPPQGSSGGATSAGGMPAGAGGTQVNGQPAPGAPSANPSMPAVKGNTTPAFDDALSQWANKNPHAAASFVNTMNAGNAGKKNCNKTIVNNLQMAINRGDITKQQASALISQGPVAGWYHLSSKGHNGTSAGAYALAHATGGALDGDSSDPKKAGDKYIASQVLSLGGILKNPISYELDPTVKHTVGGFIGSAVDMATSIGSSIPGTVAKLAASGVEQAVTGS